jgi:hypothetical protein
MCTDPGPGEPNNSMGQAFNVNPGGISDCDSDGSMVQGMLDETGSDVDWYTYSGSDTLCVVDPTRQLMGPALRICKYAQCADGSNPDVSCPTGTTSDTQGGKQGCCWTGGAPVTISFSCSFGGLGDESANIWIRVDHPGGPGCESYAFAYHF